MLNSFDSYFMDNRGKYTPTRDQFRMLLYPHGMCLHIKPSENQTSFKHLMLGSNTAKWSSKFYLNLFLMDPVNSPMIFPMDFQMKGDHISRIPLEKKYSSFKIRISRSYHIEGDPHFHCREYNQDLS